MKHVDCYAGIGGFSLGFESEGFETVAFIEYEPTKQAVLRHHWQGIPIYGDIKQIDWRAFLEAHGRPDVITAGVPCQPTSSLGKQLGDLDPRWLWPQTIGMVGGLRPRIFVAENPPAILTLDDGRAWNGIVSGLVAIGYDLFWDVFSAASFGAGHLRERVILIASNPDDSRLQGHAGDGVGVREQGRLDAEPRRPVATPDLRGRVRDFQNGLPWWHATNSGVPVLAHGIPGRLAEAASLCVGDAISPQAAQCIARAVKEILNPQIDNPANSD